MRPLIILSSALAACAPDVPAAPSFQQHVAPILAASCVRCHGVPMIGGAPREFRLDMFGDVEVRDRGGEPAIVRGAASYAIAIALRVADDDAPMPPRFPLDAWQIETLQRWAEDPIRGEPRPGNAAPTATLDAVAQDGDLVAIELRVGDADPDIVGGVLRARLGATVIPVALVHAGINRITWDVTADARGAYALEAVLDDGAGEVTIELGPIAVEGP